MLPVVAALYVVVVILLVLVVLDVVVVVLVGIVLDVVVVLVVAVVDWLLAHAPAAELTLVQTIVHHYFQLFANEEEHYCAPT